MTAAVRSGDLTLHRFAARLQANPGEWRRWPKEIRPTSARTYRTGIPAGRLLAFPAGQFEAKVRGNTELLVRFVGGAQ